MAVRIPPPVDYRRHDDRVGTIPGTGSWPWPRMQQDEAGVWWRECVTNSVGWRYLGYAPRPRGRWQRLWFHWRHGRLMGYPRRHVLSFALRDVTGRLKPNGNPERAA